MDRRFHFTSNQHERTWSTEALRGSLDSSPSMAQPSTPRHGRAAARLNAVEAAAASLESSQKSTIDRWLDSPIIDDVSPVVSAVSELFSTRADSATTSPVTTCSSSTPSLFARKDSVVSAYHLSPSSSQPSQTLRGQNTARAESSSSASAQAGRGSSAVELPEVGAFATRTAAPPQQQPRRQMRYRPLSTWDSLWLQEETEKKGTGDSPGSTTRTQNDAKEGTTKDK